MTGQTNHANIVSHIFAAELSSESDLIGLLQEFLLQFDIAEGTTGFITSGGQRVVVVCAGKFHRQQVLLGRCSTNDDGDVVGRTGSCAEAFHFLHEEWDEGATILDAGFGLLIEVSLVGRTTALGNHKEAVFHAFGSLKVNLCWQVALGVHFIEHGERSILTVAQIVLGVSLEDTLRQSLFVAEASPYLLTLLTMNDGCTSVLTQRKLSLASYLGIAQEGQCHILIVLTGLRVAQNLGNLLVVTATQHETDIVEGLLRHHGKGLGANLQNGMSLEFAYANSLLRKEVILGLVFTQLKHGCILEFHMYSLKFRGL